MTDPVATDRTPSPRAAPRVPGEEGLWILIFGDLIVFGFMFAVFLSQRIQDPKLFTVSRQSLNQDLGFVNTLVLLTSSFAVLTATRAVRAGRPGAARVSAGVAIACGLAFAAVKISEYAALGTDGTSPGTNSFFAYYFVLTGIHLLHVIIGLGALTVLLVKAGPASASATPSRVVEGCACFWHMVDMVWLILFPLLYLAS